MIIGNGLVATALRPYFEAKPNIIAFASGVSNSRETRSEEFQREESLLQEALGRGKLLLYFGSCSVYDPELGDTPYVRHKRAMEKLVVGRGNYAIFRLPQLVGRTDNPVTLTNYIYRQITSGGLFKVWLNARRHLIDVDDVAALTAELVNTGEAVGAVTDIATPFSVSIAELVRAFEQVLEMEANYKLVRAGGSYSIDSRLAAETARRLGIVFDENYVESVIRKYYGLPPTGQAVHRDSSLRERIDSSGAGFPDPSGNG